ncbi:MAG: divergent polysaccharide deacetylase family protein [Rhizomicrobium sp.]|jgi:polysaccharide deacetylase 2 family uncharacterized protein YibQ
MRHLDLIRKAFRQHVAPRGADIAFWLVLVLALIGGGARAVSGLPALASVLIPPGLFAAEANDEARASDVTIAVSSPVQPSSFVPEVLEPVTEHGFPDWLLEHGKDGEVEARLTPPALVAHRAPEIAIVIDDLGADGADTRRAIGLPDAISLSFLPYPDATPGFAREAVRGGHQILVHVPMEPDGSDNPGPNALTTGLSTAEILRRLDWALSRVPGYSGINNHMGSRFTADHAALMPVVEALADKHVFFLDSRTTPDTIVVPLARAFGVASAGRDVFLDDEQAAGAVDRQLVALEARAREQGVAIGIGHPHAVTLAALETWTKQAAARGFVLIPVSAAIRLKTERDNY